MRIIRKTNCNCKEDNMEQKFQIPKMSTEEIAKWYSTIKPIVRKNGKSNYLRELSLNELTKTSYTWLTNPKDYAEVVDYSKLSVITDVKMLHTYGYYGFFKPSVGEVIQQIPKRFLKDVVAFEILDGAIAMNSIYREELNAGYHVSVVRLYRTITTSHLPAIPINCWPNKYSKRPLNMLDSDFRKIMNLSK